MKSSKKYGEDIIIKKESVIFIATVFILTLCLLTACSGEQEVEATAVVETIEEITEEAAQPSDDIDTESETQFVVDVGFSDEQEAVAQEIIQGLVYEAINHELYVENLKEEDRTSDFMIEFLYEILNHAGEESNIVTYVGEDISLCPMYDKESALKNIGDIFQRPLTEEDIKNYNAEYYQLHGKDLIDINDDVLKITDKTDDVGEITCIQYSYNMLPFMVSFWIGYKVEPIAEDFISAKYVDLDLIIDPDSFFGYSIQDAWIPNQEYIEPELSGEIVTLEGTLAIDGEGAAGLRKFKEYCLNVYDEEGNISVTYFLKEDDGRQSVIGNHPEWDEDHYARVCITGEIDDSGYLWVYELTPLTRWDPETSEEVAIE